MDFIQIFHDTERDHWILLTNVTGEFVIFDPLGANKVSESLLTDLAAFLRLDAAAVTMTKFI